MNRIHTLIPKTEEAPVADLVQSSPRYLARQASMPSISAIGMLLTAVIFAHVRNSQVGFDKFALPKELSLQILTLVVCAKVLADRNYQRAISSSWACWPSVLLCGFVVWSVVSWLATATNAWEASRAVGISASMLMLWVMVGASNERDTVAIIRITVVILSCASVASTLEAVGFFPGLSLPHRGPGGVFGNRNYASHIFVLALPACWYLYRRAHCMRHVMWLSLATSLVIVPIVFGRTRGAWLGALVALASGSLAYASGRQQRQKPRRRDFERASLAVMILAIILGLASGRLITARLWTATPDPLTETARHIADASVGSGHGRLIQYSTTLKIIRDHPILGVGPGNWGVAYARYATADDSSYDRHAIDPVNRFASSDFLDLAAERGLLGVGLLLAALGISWLGCLRATQSSPARLSQPNDVTNYPTRVAPRNIAESTTDRREELRERFIALTALVCSYIAMGMVDSLLVQAPVTGVIAILAGGWSKKDRSPFPATRFGGRSAVPIFVAVIVASFTVFSAARLARSLFVVATYSTQLSLANLNTLTRVAPGEYALHVLVAKRAARVGNCRLMRDQIVAADALFPFRPLEPLLGSECSTGKRSLPLTAGDVAQ